MREFQLLMLGICLQLVSLQGSILKQFPLLSLAYWGQLWKLWKPLVIVNPQKDIQYCSQEVVSPSDL